MNFKDLHIHGEVRTDLLHRILYSTDASAYREMPLAVAFPKDETDVQEIVRYASKNHINLIPRAGGTSLAGQVVGKGLVVDISRYMNHILEINPEERWVRVQPGVVLDELNLYCKPYCFSVLKPPHPIVVVWEEWSVIIHVVLIHWYMAVHVIICWRQKSY